MNIENPTPTPQSSQTDAPQNAAKPVTAADLLSLEMPPVTGAPAVNPEAAPNAPDAANATPAPLPVGVPETDKRGVRYDPLRHLPKLHPVTNCWMPRKHRKTPQSAAWTAPQAAPASQSYIPPEPTAPHTESGTDAANTANATDAAPDAKPAMPVASARAVAECATNAGYALTGALIGNAKAARPSPAEHANLRDTAAAYIEARGLRFIGGAAVLIGVLAYLLGEDRRGAIIDGVKNLIAKLRKPPMKTVAAVTAQGASAANVSQPAAEQPNGPPAGVRSAFSS